MKKGKLKKEEKRISILLIPHSPSDVKVHKYTVHYSKLRIALITTLILLACLFIATLYTFHANSVYKKTVSQLSDLNAEQQVMLKEKADQITKFSQKEKDINKKIGELVDKYREITDNYIKGHSSATKSSRSGDRTVGAFVGDLNVLKTLLSDVKSTMDSNNRFFSELTETEKQIKKYVDTIPTLWPAHGPISSGFGGRRDPLVWSKAFHEGIDIAANYGEDIRAAASGKVVFSGYMKVYGRAIIIEHGHGITTLYGHSSKLIAKEGQTVKKGDIIAKVGSSGRSTGAHLHFEVTVNGSPIDPLKYLDKKK